MNITPDMLLGLGFKRSISYAKNSWDDECYTLKFVDFKLVLNAFHGLKLEVAHVYIRKSKGERFAYDSTCVSIGVDDNYAELPKCDDLLKLKELISITKI